MPFVSTTEMLRKAQRGGYAVGAFNCENMEMAQAIVEAAVRLHAPVILQTTPSTVRYASLAMYRAMVATLAQDAPVPVAMHLDHGDSPELARQAMEAGYTSVMIDGSHHVLEENIAITRSVVEMAQARGGIPVEAELGRVGGKEDDLEAGEGGYTDPSEAETFARETGAASLAVGIGTAHGFYAGTPVLDVPRLARIRAKVEIPLVLHGASGLSDEDVRACIREGICKVNFATELRAAYSQGVKDCLAENPKVYDPKAYGKVARARVTDLVMERMQVCGCAEKA